MNRARFRKSNVLIHRERQSHKKQVRSGTVDTQMSPNETGFWDYEINHIFLVMIWSQSKLDLQGKSVHHVAVLEGPPYECELDLIIKILLINLSQTEDLTPKDYM